MIWGSEAASQVALKLIVANGDLLNYATRKGTKETRLWSIRHAQILSNTGPALYSGAEPSPAV